MISPSNCLIGMPLISYPYPAAYPPTLVLRCNFDPILELHEGVFGFIHAHFSLVINTAMRTAEENVASAAPPRTVPLVDRYGGYSAFRRTFLSDVYIHKTYACKRFFLHDLQSLDTIFLLLLNPLSLQSLSGRSEEVCFLYTNSYPLSQSN